MFYTVETLVTVLSGEDQFNYFIGLYDKKKKKLQKQSYGSQIPQ